MIWRTHHRDIFAEGWDAVRRELTRVYSRFYGTFVGGLILIFNFISYLKFFVFVLQAYWIPQIIHDARKGAKNSFSLRFILGMSVTRCLASLYLWGCPSSIFNGDLYPELPGSPDPLFCVALVL